MMLLLSVIRRPPPTLRCLVASVACIGCSFWLQAITNRWCEASHIDYQAPYFNNKGSHIDCETLHIDCKALHINSDTTHINCEALYINCEALHINTDTAHINNEAWFLNNQNAQLDCTTLCG